MLLFVKKTLWIKLFGKVKIVVKKSLNVLKSIRKLTNSNRLLMIPGITMSLKKNLLFANIFPFLKVNFLFFKKLILKY